MLNFGMQLPYIYQRKQYKVGFFSFFLFKEKKGERERPQMKTIPSKYTNLKSLRNTENCAHTCDRR